MNHYMNMDAVKPHIFIVHVWEAILLGVCRVSSLSLIDSACLFPCSFSSYFFFLVLLRLLTPINKSCV